MKIQPWSKPCSYVTLDRWERKKYIHIQHAVYCFLQYCRLSCSQGQTLPHTLFCVARKLLLPLFSGWPYLVRWWVPVQKEISLVGWTFIMQPNRRRTGATDHVGGLRKKGTRGDYPLTKCNLMMHRNSAIRFFFFLFGFCVLIGSFVVIQPFHLDFINFKGKQKNNVQVLTFYSNVG